MDLYVRFYRKCEAFFKEKQIRFDILKFLYKVLPVLEAAVYCGLIIYSFVKEDYLMFTKCIVVPATAFVVVSIFRKLIAITRVVSGMHFTKDVIAGAVIGILSGIIYFVF